MPLSQDVTIRFNNFMGLETQEDVENAVSATFDERILEAGDITFEIIGNEIEVTQAFTLKEGLTHGVYSTPVYMSSGYSYAVSNCVATVTINPHGEPSIPIELIRASYSVRNAAYNGQYKTFVDSGSGYEWVNGDGSESDIIPESKYEEISQEPTFWSGIQYFIEYYCDTYFIPSSLPNNLTGTLIYDTWHDSFLDFCEDAGSTLYTSSSDYGFRRLVGGVMTRGRMQIGDEVGFHLSQDVLLAMNTMWRILIASETGLDLADGTSYASIEDEDEPIVLEQDEQPDPEDYKNEATALASSIAGNYDNYESWENTDDSVEVDRFIHAEITVSKVSSSPTTWHVVVSARDRAYVYNSKFQMDLDGPASAYTHWDHYTLAAQNYNQVEGGTYTGSLIGISGPTYNDVDKMQIYETGKAMDDLEILLQAPAVVDSLPYPTAYYESLYSPTNFRMTTYDEVSAVCSYGVGYINAPSIPPEYLP